MPSRRVLKWEISTTNWEDRRIPGRYLGAAALDESTVEIWTEVVGEPNDSPRVPYTLYGTGQPIAANAAHVATVKAPPYVWHLYQTGPTEEEKP